MNKLALCGAAAQAAGLLANLAGAFLLSKSFVHRVPVWLLPEVLLRAMFWGGAPRRDEGDDALVAGVSAAGWTDKLDPRTALRGLALVEVGLVLQLVGLVLMMWPVSSGVSAAPPAGPPLVP